MKKLLLLLTVIYGSLSAQNNLCCKISVNDKNNMLAMNESFAKTHTPPLPFTLQNGKGHMIAFKTPDGKPAHAYLVKSEKPAGKAIFVFHEWWGLNDYIKQEAEKLEEEFFDADIYALDLYDGNVATTVAEAQKYMGEMKEDRSKSIIKGAIDYVGKNTKIASIGWCMGGAWSLQSALMEGNQAVACVVYYGMPEKDIKKLKTLNCDVFGVFGTQDKFISPEVVKTFEDDMKKAGKKLSVHNYNADHAFANPSNPKYNRPFADDAHGKAIMYLKEKLK